MYSLGNARLLEFCGASRELEGLRDGPAKLIVEPKAPDLARAPLRWNASSGAGCRPDVALLEDFSDEALMQRHNPPPAIGERRPLPDCAMIQRELK